MCVSEYSLRVQLIHAEYDTNNGLMESHVASKGDGDERKWFLPQMFP